MFCTVLPSSGATEQEDRIPRGPCEEGRSLHNPSEEGVRAGFEEEVGKRST